MTDERFDIAKHPNEPNRAGYIVEIDPLDPKSTPQKRTALGRFKHENAEVVLAAGGRVVVYMGDDERGEFIYKFVSDGRYAESGDNSNLLENGKLFAAKFAEGGRGEWVELTPKTTGMASQAEICIHTRIAASAVAATTMDRAEWVAANPKKAEVFCCLTNNKNRGKKPNKGGDATPVGGPNPRANNRYGQIVRWAPDGGDHLSTAFSWDLYVVAGNPAVHKGANAGSKNVTPYNMFNSPDGLAFDRNGMLWIQTDGKYTNTKGFAGPGQQPDARGRPGDGRDPPLHGGPQTMRGYGHRVERGREDHVRGHPAPRREEGGQPLSRRRRHHAPLVRGRHHPRRRRHDRLNPHRVLRRVASAATRYLQAFILNASPPCGRGVFFRKLAGRAARPEFLFDETQN